MPKKILEYVFLSIVGIVLSIIAVFPAHATVLSAATVLSIGPGGRIEEAGERIWFQQKDPAFKDDVITLSSTDGRNDFIVYSTDILAMESGQGCVSSRVRTVVVDSTNMMSLENIRIAKG